MACSSVDSRPSCAPPCCASRSSHFHYNRDTKKTTKVIPSAAYAVFRFRRWLVCISRTSNENKRKHRFANNPFSQTRNLWKHTSHAFTQSRERSESTRCTPVYCLDARCLCVHLFTIHFEFFVCFHVFSSPPSRAPTANQSDLLRIFLHKSDLSKLVLFVYSSLWLRRLRQRRPLRRAHTIRSRWPQICVQWDCVPRSGAIQSGRAFSDGCATVRAPPNDSFSIREPWAPHWIRSIAIVETCTFPRPNKYHSIFASVCQVLVIESSVECMCACVCTLLFSGTQFTGAIRQDEIRQVMVVYARVSSSHHNCYCIAWRRYTRISISIESREAKQRISNSQYRVGMIEN